MIRVWNCSGDRLAVAKGARTVQISSNEQVFFGGEIRKASLEKGFSFYNFENILFTVDPAVL